MNATTLVAAVAAIHVCIPVVEMLLLAPPCGRTVFGSTREFADSARVRAQRMSRHAAAR